MLLSVLPYSIVSHYYIYIFIHTRHVCRFTYSRVQLRFGVLGPFTPPGPTPRVPRYCTPGAHRMYIGFPWCHVPPWLDSQGDGPSHCIPCQATADITDQVGHVPSRCRSTSAIRIAQSTGSRANRPSVGSDMAPASHPAGDLGLRVDASD